MIESLIKGITLGLLLSIAVGPVLFSIIKHSINVGHKGGMAFVVGVSASDISIAFLSNVFSALFEAISEHKQLIGITGSLFLMIIGIYFLFFKKVKINEQGKAIEVSFRKRDYAKLFLSGYLMNTLNPSVFIFWLTATTSVINHTIRERVVIFSTCLLLVLVADIAKVMLAGKIRNRLTPHNIHWINRLNGIILIGFSIALIIGLLYYKAKINI
ncbi:MAG TPA: LysE family transporter [Niabella sp.]|nr:LysE family transporter [Niabella sp.]HQW14373.1 LysE family transporter [Niabella sp.]HQX18348.1 LysE family transporter [Niabella sp.]HQX40160.1 LysE family transporter [Niabella sp.]HRB05873.1 LysE family transporter [Niabella sp.]